MICTFDITFINFSANQYLLHLIFVQLDRQELKSMVAARNLRIATLEDELASKNEKIDILSRSLGRRDDREELHQSNEKSITMTTSGTKSIGSPLPIRQVMNNGTGESTNAVSSFTRESSSCAALSSPAAITPSSTRASKFESLKQRYLKKVQSPKITGDETPIPQIHKYNLRKTNTRG